MSRSISVIFLILIVIIAGFAYVNYNRLNQIQSELLEKEVLLEDSGQLIKEQEASIAQLEERVKEKLDREELSSEEQLRRDREDEFQKQLTDYQVELQELREKLETAIQQSEIESQDIIQLREEKSRLEVQLKEKEDQWQSREEENQKMIVSLQDEIQKYEIDIKTVNEKILNFEKHLESEIMKRNDLEQDMIQYEANIALLQEKLALEQDDEIRVLEISQLQVNKKQLEEEIKEKDAVLDQIQEEYQALKTQLADYEQKIIGLQEEMVMMKEQESALDEIQGSLAQLKEEKSKLELLLQEREAKWLIREQENQEIIARLQENIQEYKSSIQTIEIETIALKEDLLEEKLSREQLIQNIAHYERQIMDLKGNLENKTKVDEKMEQKLSQLEQEKSKLEDLLKEKEEQWLVREQENQETIARFQEEVQKYELNIKEIGNEMLSLREDLIQESSFKDILQKEIKGFATEIHTLKEKVAYYQEIERSYQDTFDQLQSDKEILEKKLTEKGLEIEQQEYQDLLNQLSNYQNQIEELKKELAFAREKEDAILAAQFAKIQEEKEAVERLLAEKDDEWVKQNQENKELIAYLKNQLEKYQEEIEVIKIDSSLLKEEIAAQVELQQEITAQIKGREEQISKLTTEIEQYAKKMDDYENTVDQLRMTLRQQENLSYHEQEDLMERLISLVTDRDISQNNINQCHNQVKRLELEIFELQNKIALLEKEEESQYYEVKSGDCLWTIAKNKYNEGIAWTKIFKANQQLIENPDLIYPYQQIILPE